MSKVDIKAALRAGFEAAVSPTAPAPGAVGGAAPPPPAAAGGVKAMVKRVSRRLRPIVGRVATYLMHPAIARIDQAAQERQQVIARVNSLQEAQANIHETLMARLDVLEQQIAAGMAREEAATRQLTRQLSQQLSQQAEGTAARLELTRAELARTETGIQSLGVALAGLPGVFGPRFDELEIKQRPLVPYDERHFGVRLRDGYALVPKAEPRFLTMVANATSEGLEVGTRRVLVRLLEPGMTVADVGANIGLLTLACARLVGPSGKVYAFEPEPAMAAALAETLALNGLTWVDLREEAAGRTAGRATFHISPVPGHSSLYPLAAEEVGRGADVEVRIARLDEVVAGRLDVLKIDVEGAELDVLAGTERLVAENPDIAIVVEFGPVHLTRNGLSTTAWFEAFERHGLYPQAIQEPSGAVRACTIAELEAAESTNLVFVRRGSRPEARLAE